MLKKRGILALVLALCMALAVSPAMADILYTASTNWNTDRFGIIRGDEEPTKDVVTNLGGDAGSGVFSFKNADKEARVAVSQYAYAGNDTVWFYDPETTDWSAPLQEAVSPVKNIHHMVAEGNYLYAAGYDDASVGRFDMTSDAFTPDDKTFTCTPDEPGYTAHAERLAAYNGSVYAIFTASSGSYPNYVYAYHKIVKLKEDLTEEASAALKGKNLDGANVGSTLQIGKDLYVASLGGSQDTSGLFNSDSMIEKVDLETLTSETLITAADAAEKDKEWGYNFYGLAKDGAKIDVGTGQIHVLQCRYDRQARAHRVSRDGLPHADGTQEIPHSLAIVALYLMVETEQFRLWVAVPVVKRLRLPVHAILLGPLTIYGAQIACVWLYDHGPVLAEHVVLIGDKHSCHARILCQAFASVWIDGQQQLAGIFLLELNEMLIKQSVWLGTVGRQFVVCLHAILRLESAVNQQVHIDVYAFAFQSRY